MPSLRLSSIVFEHGDLRSKKIRVLSVSSGCACEASALLEIALNYVALPEDRRDDFSMPWMPETFMYSGYFDGAHHARGISLKEYIEQNRPSELNR